MLAAIRPSQHPSPTTSVAGGGVVPEGAGHGTLRDDERRQDAAARPSEPYGDRAAAALGLALDTTSDAFLLLDDDGIVRVANGNAERALGRGGDPITGTPLLELLSGPAAAVIRPAIEAASRGSQHSIDFPSGNGHTWYVAHAYPAPGGTLLHLHDVTGRHNAEEGLGFLARAGKALTSVLEERRLTRVLGRLVVPYLADWCLIVLYERGREPRVTVAARSRVLRRRLLAVASQDEETDEEADALLAVPPGGETVMLRRADRPPAAASAGIWSLASSIVKVPLTHRADGVSGVLIFGRADARHCFRRTDMQLATALGSRVATVLDKVRLYEAQQRATRLRDDVLAIVAHDLRNPLHSIMLAASALAAPAAKPAAAEQTLNQAARKAIMSAADQMHRLVDDLLDAARLDADWGPRESVLVDVADLVKTSAQAFRWHAERGGVRLETIVHGRMRVEADAGRLTEAVANLLDNAVKFTPRGGTVTLTAEPVAEGIRISVADTGPGIDPETMPRLFDRFWQARKNGRAGAGLGLFIAHRIVEGHGGRLTAESVLGKGSVFRIVLPTRLPARRAAGARRGTRSDRP
jgi:signal transduction histidine kinase